MDPDNIHNRLDELEVRIENLEKKMEGPILAPVIRKREVSAKEFLMERDVKSEPQKVLVLGYYLETVKNMPNFNVSDLETVFRSAKEKLPANMNDAVNRNIKRGLIMEAAEKKDAKKAWYLTSSGERMVSEDMRK